MSAAAAGGGKKPRVAESPAQQQQQIDRQEAIIENLMKRLGMTDGGDVHATEMPEEARQSLFQYSHAEASAGHAASSLLVLPSQ